MIYIKSRGVRSFWWWSLQRIGWHNVCDGTLCRPEFKHWMIYLYNVSLLWFCRLPILPPRCATASMRVYKKRLKSFMNMDSSEGDEYGLSMESWDFWEFSDIFCWRNNFQAAVFFYVSFFYSSFFLLFSATSLHWATLSVVGYIPKL